MMASCPSNAPSDDLGRVPLSQLLAGLVADCAQAPPVPIAQVVLDSRRAGPGTLFLACRGSQTHGLAYARAAVTAGAIAVAAEPDANWSSAAITALRSQLGVPVIPVDALGRQASLIAARCYGDPSAQLDMIGITGTNGKTSVSQFIAQVLSLEASCAFIGTLGQGLAEDAPGLTKVSGMTTPDGPELQCMLAELRHRGATAVAMEVSSHALAQHRVAAVRFDYAVLTNLTHDHLDYHGDMSAYAAAKARLFQTPGLRWAVLNAEDPFSHDLCAQLAPDVKRAFYRLSPEAECEINGELDISAAMIEHQAQGLRFDVRVRDALSGATHHGRCETPLLGRFNVANVLAVLAVLLARGMTFESALQRLSRIRGVPGRMEAFGSSGEPLCVVDYAHTPDALEQALTELRAHLLADRPDPFDPSAAGRLLLVFGCGGERDPGKRALMGAIAERLADQVILTDDNPRNEDGDAIIQAIQAGMTGTGAQVEVERQRALAIRRALLLAGAKDAVLIAGKGHETEQDLGELKLRFSDRAQVMQALREWRGSH